MDNINIISKDDFLSFCNDYLVFLERFCTDVEIRNWCLNYDGYNYDGNHQELHDQIYKDFMINAYERKIVFPDSWMIWNEDLDRRWSQKEEGFVESLEFEEILALISIVIRSDHTADDLAENIGDGTLFHLFSAAKAKALGE